MLVILLCMKRKQVKKEEFGICVESLSPEKKKEYYESNEGMLTKVWGPMMWGFLHTISFNYKINPS